jgi:hypothetical protein
MNPSPGRNSRQRDYAIDFFLPFISFLFDAGLHSEDGSETEPLRKLCFQLFILLHDTRLLCGLEQNRSKRALVKSREGGFFFHPNEQRSHVGDPVEEKAT